MTFGIRHPSNGSVMVFMGRDHNTYLRWLDTFSKFGHIPGHNCWSSKIPKVNIVCGKPTTNSEDSVGE